MRSVQTLGSTQGQRPRISPACLALAGTDARCLSVCPSFTHPPSCLPLLHARYGASRSYGGSDSSAGLLPDRGLPASRHMSFETIPPPITRRPPSPLSHATPQLDGSPLSGSRLRHWLAGSPDTSGRIEFVILRTGLSPPVAPHPASRRRSYLRLQAGERMPEEDLHLSDISALAGALAWRFSARFGEPCFHEVPKGRRKLLRL